MGIQLKKEDYGENTVEFDIMDISIVRQRP